MYLEDRYLHKFLIVLDRLSSQPVRHFKELPLVISSEYEGYEIETVRRLNYNITLRDIRARMPRHISTFRGSNHLNPTALAMRGSTFREEACCVSWRPRTTVGSSTKRDCIQFNLPRTCVDANSTESLKCDITINEIINIRNPRKPSPLSLTAIEYPPTNPHFILVENGHLIPVENGHGVKRKQVEPTSSIVELESLPKRQNLQSRPSCPTIHQAAGQRHNWFVNHSPQHWQESQDRYDYQNSSGPSYQNDNQPEPNHNSSDQRTYPQQRAQHDQRNLDQEIQYNQNGQMYPENAYVFNTSGSGIRDSFTIPPIENNNGLEPRRGEFGSAAEQVEESVHFPKRWYIHGFYSPPLQCSIPQQGNQRNPIVPLEDSRPDWQRSGPTSLADSQPFESGSIPSEYPVGVYDETYNLPRNSTGEAGPIHALPYDGSVLEEPYPLPPGNDQPFSEIGSLASINTLGADEINYESPSESTWRSGPVQTMPRNDPVVHVELDPPSPGDGHTFDGIESIPSNHQVGTDEGNYPSPSSDSTTGSGQVQTLRNDHPDLAELNRLLSADDQPLDEGGSSPPRDPFESPPSPGDPVWDPSKLFADGEPVVESGSFPSSSRDPLADNIYALPHLELVLPGCDLLLIPNPDALEPAFERRESRQTKPANDDLSGESSAATSDTLDNQAGQIHRAVCEDESRQNRRRRRMTKPAHAQTLNESGSITSNGILGEDGDAYDLPRNLPNEAGPVYTLQRDDAVLPASDRLPSRNKNVPKPEIEPPGGYNADLLQPRQPEPQFHSDRYFPRDLDMRQMIPITPAENNAVTDAMAYTRRDFCARLGLDIEEAPPRMPGLSYRDDWAYVQTTFTIYRPPREKLGCWDSWVGTFDGWKTAPWNPGAHF